VHVTIPGQWVGDDGLQPVTASIKANSEMNDTVPFFSFSPPGLWQALLTSPPFFQPRCTLLSFSLPSWEQSQARVIALVLIISSLLTGLLKCWHLS